MASESFGTINALEAYSKHELMKRLGISQRFWDQMLDEGLPYCNVGHGRWVTGQAIIDYMNDHLVTKTKAADKDE